MPKFLRKILDFLLAIVLLKWLLNFCKSVISIFVPTTPFSYQTLFLLSLFAYFMSMLSDGIVRKLLLAVVGIFLILGVYWATTANKELWIYRDQKAKPKKDGLPLSAWITGAILCIYIFICLPMLLLDRIPESGGPLALVAWPLISVIIAAAPNFMELEEDELRAKTPSPSRRQNLVILFSINILISCWFQFYFLIQNWLTQYPSLMADDFSQSAFVVQIAAPTQLEKQIGFQPKRPRGVAILETMELDLKEQLDGKLWSEVEKLLLPEEREKWVTAVAEKAKTKLSPVKEDRLWTVTSDVSSRDSGYSLELQAIWQGPHSRPESSYPEQKSCQITPVYPQTVATSSVKCEPVKGGIGDKDFIVF
ncbi:MAG: DUF5357 domain-containing protein [Symploca sp. SIO3E6]|nr:DUF5357 domain-containing protein [Caldora sp. SIO3E6]